jgi:hypothetical protein
MPQLSDTARRTTLLALRAMFPHDALPDAPYERVVDSLAATADADAAAQLEQGAARLDAGGIAGMDAGQRLAVLEREAGSPYFELLRSTAVAQLYDDPEVWSVLGYEGASVHLGGYVERGFDDLDWLPDPPLVMDPSAGSHHQ